MKNLSEKGITHIAIVFIVLIVAIGAVWFLLNEGKFLFFENKDGLGPSGMKVPIAPSQLMPLVSAKEARTTICNLKKEGLFSQACQSKYDTVTKDDGEKIVELFTLIEEIKNDKSISDYDRLLLSQAVFAALPTKDSPEASLYQPSLLSRLKDYLTSRITLYAQGQIMSEEEFKEMMKKDLQNMVDNLPKKGDNAWVVNVMLSKYSWIDGKRQPTYSHQYAEVYDPFPNNPNVNTKDITYHIQARVGSKASSQTIDVGGPVYKGTSEMIAYSFTIQSWKSQEYTDKKGSVEEKFLVKKNNFSESFYRGEHYLNDLLEAVKMPSTRRPAESSDEQTDQTSVESKIITCKEAKKILSKDKCPWFVSPNGRDPAEIWCFFEPPTYDSSKGLDHFVVAEKRTRPPDYTMDASEWGKCK